MAVNRFMGPVRVRPRQTYVDQYVPLPFDAITKALGTRQNTFDTTKAQADALLGLSVDVDEKDVEDRDAILQGYSDRVSELVNQAGGDYSQLRGDVAQLANEVNVDFTRGNLAGMNQQYQAIQADRAQKQKDIEKGFDKGGILANRAEELLNKSYGDYQSFLSGSRYGGIQSAAQYDRDRIASEIGKDWKADAVEQGFWQQKDGTWMQRVKGKDVVADAEQIMATVYDKFRSDPRIQAEIDQMLDLGHTPEEINKELINSAERAGEIYGFRNKSRIEDIKAVPEGGGAGARNAQIGYNFYKANSINRTIDPEALNTKKSSVVSSITDIQTKIAGLQGDNTVEGINAREQLTGELKQLEYQKRSIKETLKGMAEAGGYNWKEAYDTFVLKFGAEQSGNNFIPLTEEDTKAMLDQYKGVAPTFEDFKDAVIEGGYLADTPVGVDYNDPVFRDRNFDENMLGDFIIDFNNVINNNPEARNFAEQNVGVEGGTKTWGNRIQKKLVDNLKTGQSVELLMSDGKQFHANNEEFLDYFGDDEDWISKANIELLRDPVNGRPAIQISGKNSEGKVGNFTLTVGENSPLISDIEEIGYEMIESANNFSSPKKQKEHFDTGAYLLGSTNFPEVSTSNIDSKPVNTPFNIRIRNQDEVVLQVTPLNKGGKKMYRALLVSPDGQTPINGEEIIYDNPQQIVEAMGRNIYLNP